MVGQASARKVAEVIIKMVQEGKIAGKFILLARQPGVRKTAIAMGMANPWRRKRWWSYRATGQWWLGGFKDRKADAKDNRGGEGDLWAKIIEALVKEKVQSGETYCNKASGNIMKLGRSFSRSRDYDAMGPQTKFVQCP
ncbi:P-loop containing nucleoside triphosphate hydrolase superfamily protein [Forsythia ovata]|uniref:RuvB-like helicase n=1 Tax=Forsythia ovata TaxID=205694 RepID=A0ABD1UCE3_9LAMI